jgi:hypothetical protein
MGHLEGNFAAQLLVVASVDHAETTGAEPGLHDEAAQAPRRIGTSGPRRLEPRTK